MLSFDMTSRIKNQTELNLVVKEIAQYFQKNPAPGSEEEKYIDELSGLILEYVESIGL